MIEIAKAVGVTYKQAFVLDNDEKIEITSMQQKDLKFHRGGNGNAITWKKH